MKAIVAAVVAASAAGLAVAVLFVLRRLAAPPGTGFDRKSVSLEVFNGCGAPRMARAVADELLRRGFDVYDTGNCDSVVERTAVIDLRDPSGDRAETVAAELAVGRRWWFVPLRGRLAPEARAGLDSSRFVDLRVVVGRDHGTFFPGVLALR
ncbi:MAG: LytR C-terminal domain-containing protein [bacterium]